MDSLRPSQRRYARNAFNLAASPRVLSIDEDRVRCWAIGIDENEDLCAAHEFNVAQGELNINLLWDLISANEDNRGRPN